ncbi:hypothetical protein TcasGA2_TC016294 [Tribolium castaneum]|uniref:Uncharacterized protein n=1 Tax=Tribolium castaneum TaxID=7070 RepID=D6X2X1_TRICA|nr:hypothetical protein TcasGA2_TC016294 [Tribolium castaneum]
MDKKILGEQRNVSALISITSYTMNEQQQTSVQERCMESLRRSCSTTLIKSKSNYHLDFMLIKSQSRRGWRTDEPLPYSLYLPFLRHQLPPDADKNLLLQTSLAFAPCPSMRQISLRPERSIGDKFRVGRASGIH